MKRLILLLTTTLLCLPIKAQLSWGTMIGQTYYDLATYGSSTNRLVRNSDGSLSATWIEHWDFLTQSNQTTGVLGFGYNHFDPAQGWIYGTDGECWEVDNGCASAYTCSPQIINISNSGVDDEIIFSDLPLKKTSRQSIGAGSWSNTQNVLIESIYNVSDSTTNTNAAYPRTVSSGNYIHMITCFNDVGLVDSFGIENTIRYYRSSDAGQTWDITNYVLPFDTTDMKYVGRDAYAIYSNDSIVAITCGYGPNNSWIMLKSTDDGQNWVKTVIQQNINLDTIAFSPDTNPIYLTSHRDFDVLIDDSGTVHCFTTNVFTDGEEIYNNPKWYKNYSEVGILYWNEGMTESKVIARPDFGYDGDTANYSVSGAGNYGTGMVAWPNGSFDSEGNLFIIFSAIAEGTSFINQTTGDTIGYYDLYLVTSNDNGISWGGIYDFCGLYFVLGNPINIAELVYEQFGSTPTQDDILPSTVKKIEPDGILHFTWQGDWNRPSLALLDDTHPNDNLNYIHYGALDFSAFYSPKYPNVNNKDGQGIDCSGIKEQLNNLKISIAPNPASNFVVLEASSTIQSIKILDVLGKEVYIKTIVGSNNIRVETRELNEGMYLVKVESAIGVATQKLIIKR